MPGCPVSEGARAAAAAPAGTGGDFSDCGLVGGQEPLGRDVFARGQPDGAGVVRAGRTGDITSLLRACLVAIRLPADAGALYRVPGPPFWSVTDAAERIRAMLPLLGEEGAALAAFLPEVALDALERELRCRVAVAATFLAGLELDPGWNGRADPSRRLAVDSGWQARVPLSCRARDLYRRNDATRWKQPRFNGQPP